jgi:tetratricopeptide (TPR) repeat protein
LQERGQANLIEAERLFRAALALDPRYAKAWAGLAMTLIILTEYSPAPLAETWSEAHDAAEYALALEPTLPETYVALGYIAGGEFRFATSHALFDRALELAPSFATGYQWYGRMLLFEGEFARASDLIEKAVSLDPKGPTMHGAHVNLLRALGRNDEALEVCKRHLADWLLGEFCGRLDFSVAVTHDDFPAARTALRLMSERRGPDAVQFAEQLMDALEGKEDSRNAAARLADLPDGTRDLTSLTPLGGATIIQILKKMGYQDLAFRRFGQQVRESPYFARGWLINARLYGVDLEPEFQAFAQELRIDEARAAELFRKAE